MELLKKRIIEEGSSKGGGDIVKVSSFLNHQLDIELLNEIGKEFARRFKYDGKISNVLHRYKSLCRMLCQVDHDPEGIPPLSRDYHIFRSPFIQLFIIYYITMEWIKIKQKKLFIFKILKILSNHPTN